MRPSGTPPAPADPVAAHAAHRRPADPTITIVGAIPARWASSRLPGKPLAEIAGRPMIEHVYRRASRTPSLARVIVLTDDARIAQAVEGFGGDVMMTPEDCASGTDRIAWAAARWPDADAVINIQGDEPLIDPAALEQVAQRLRDAPEDPIVTLAAPAADGEHDDPNAVKVVRDLRGYALYFSRSRLPYPRHAGEATVWKHVGVYGYRRDALMRLAALDPTALERSESLEQLRALEHGIPIHVLSVDTAEPGVDTPEDLARVAARLEPGAAEPAP